jgi:hypothetical protein
MSNERQSPADIAKRQVEAQRQLMLDYKATFTTEKGRRVLADLKHRFGFGRWAAKDTKDGEVIVRRVFMQGPIHHIQDMLDANPRKEPKPNKALSASHHENATASPPA